MPVVSNMWLLTRAVFDYHLQLFLHGLALAQPLATRHRRVVSQQLDNPYLICFAYTGGPFLYSA